MSYEWQLMALAVGLYVFDVTLMLRPDEAVLVDAGRAGWLPRFGLDRFLLGGRAPCVLNLFTPQRTTFRLRWRLGRLDAPLCGRPEWSELGTTLRPLGPYTLSAGFALFGLLPLGFFTRLGSMAVVPALLLLYVSLTAALVLLYRRRETLGLTRQAFATLAFESVACPPFGVNLIRRIALAREPAEAFPAAARLLLNPDGWSTVQRVCAARLDDAIDAEPDGSPRVAALAAHRASFPRTVAASDGDD